MAALDFPTSPALGQIHPSTPVAGQSQYQWNGSYWLATGNLGDFVKRSGDIMSGALTVTPKGSMFGWSGGAGYADAVSQGDANIKLYASDATNWCGMGVDPGGNFWIRTGTSGTPTPALGIGVNRAINMPGSLAVGGIGNFGSAITAGGFTTGGQVSCTSLTVNETAGGVIYQSGGSAFTVQAPAGGHMPMITFYMPSFACNFGMSTDGNFYMGGWSHGSGINYRFWTSKDFAAPSEPYYAHRMRYVGDYEHGINAGLAEPYGGNCSVTGACGFNNTTGSLILRYRAHEILLPGSGWVGVQLA